MKAIQQLQLEVLTKFGTTPLQPSDCKDLSSIVRDATGKIVSETTIKRFYGFAAQTFNFSVYTLNALSEYAGFGNWEFFLEHYRQQQSPQKEHHPKWQEVKSKTGKISFFTTETIKNNCGMDFARTAPRIDELPMRSFLEEGPVVSVLLAPAACGKSIALAQAAETLWLSESCLYPNDICLFLHIHHLNTLVNRGFSMEDWLDNQLNLGDGENILDYFEEHTAEKDGKFILIVDGLDDRVIASDKLRIIYSKLMDLVFSRVHSPWLKVILAARPEAWNILYTPIPQDPIQIMHLPELSAQQVKTVLRNHGLSEDSVSTLKDSFVNLLSFPPFLQVACASLNNPLNEEYLTYHILGQYARTKVMNSPDHGLKMAILRRILDDTHNLQAKMPSGQARLFSGDARIQESYRKLLADGILEEDNQDGPRSLPVRRVKFANDLMARFFVATFCVSTHNGALTEGLFREILSFESIRAQTDILQWILLYAMDQGDCEAIECLFGMISELPQKATLFEFLLGQPAKSEPLMHCLSGILEEDDFKTYFLRNHLLYTIHGHQRNLLNSSLQKVLVREEDVANVACLYFLSGLHQLDGDIMRTQLPVLQSSVKALNREGSALQPGELCLFIYDLIEDKPADQVTREKIDQFEEYLLLSDHAALSLRDELSVYLLICCGLMLHEYKFLERVPDYVFAEIPSLKMRLPDPFRLLSLMMKCRYHLYEGDYGQYNKQLTHVETVLNSGPLPDGAHVVAFAMEQVRAVRLYMDGEYEKMLESVQKVQAPFRKMRLYLIDHWCYKMQAAAYQGLRKQKLSMLAEQEADRIRQKFPFPVLPPFELQGFAEDVTTTTKQAINH